jgi:hypothetical protein
LSHTNKKVILLLTRGSRKHFWFFPFFSKDTVGCGHWSRFEVKILVEQPVSDPEVKAFIPTYAPVKAETCRKYGKRVTEPKELSRIRESET